MASVYREEYQRVITALKNARKARSISQAQLAEVPGKPQSFIAKVEFVHLARRVDVEVEEVLQWIGEK